MTDQALIVAALVVAVVVVVMLLRRFSRTRARTIDAPGFEPGVYLFTSGGCDTCAGARETLVGRGVAFTELTWDDDPEVFQRLGMDAVPSVLVVTAGRGRWWRGSVPRQIPGYEGRRG